MKQDKTFSVFRYKDENDSPSMENFIVPAGTKSTVLDALLYIRDEVDHTLQFDYVCSNAICGSCAMMINGFPRLACRTLVEGLPEIIQLHPLPNFKMLGDLSVDTSTYFAANRNRYGFWLHSSGKDDLKAYKDITIDNEESGRIHELERCIECGCCMAACPTVAVNSSFAGPYNLLAAGRFLIDMRDSRSKKEWYDVFASENGVFGCSSVLACESYCPKGIPIASTLANVRRSLVFAGVIS